MSQRLFIALLALTTTACVVRRPMGHEAPHVPGVRIIRASQAKARKLGGRSFELRFGDRQDGTKLVLDFLAEAKKKGARFVSDIRIVLATRKAQRDLLCETRLLPVAKKETWVVPKAVPGRTETKWVSKPVTRTITEQRYQCRMVSRPVSRMETRYETRYDYSSKRSRSVPVTRTVTRYEYKNECRYVPTTRTVTRYEHQMQTRYIPPSVKYLSAHYTDFNLVESRPRCQPQGDAINARLRHRIVGTIYADK